jgi:hypothetical protein
MRKPFKTLGKNDARRILDRWGRVLNYSLLEFGQMQASERITAPRSPEAAHDGPGASSMAPSASWWMPLQLAPLAMAPPLSCWPPKKQRSPPILAGFSSRCACNGPAAFRALIAGPGAAIHRPLRKR